MSAIVFDTYLYVKKLKSVGFTEEQAEVQAEALTKLIDERLTTKQDLAEMELRLKHDLTLRLGGMMLAGISVVAGLVKLL